MLIENEPGNYLFLPSSSRYSAAVVASPGYEIVRAVFNRPRALAEGFELIQAHLQSQRRPRAALCALELRSPEPLTFANFASFNESYRALLNEWGVTVGSHNPIARTNVAPAIERVSEPAIYAFSYSVPLPSQSTFRSFIISGAGEVGEPNLTPEGIIRAGETSDDALFEKAAFVMRAMRTRLDAVDARLSQVTAVDIYTIHSIPSATRVFLLESLEGASKHGLTWYHAQPPITGLEFEMDLRGVRMELCI